MKSIWKYELEITDEQTVKLPAGSVVLSVAAQGCKLCMWARVDPAKGSRGDVYPMQVYVVGTGNPIPDGCGRFIGTVVMNPFVWHVFIEV